MGERAAYICAEVAPGPATSASWPGCAPTGRSSTDWTVEQGDVRNPSAVSVPMYRALGFRPAEDLMRLDL
jgi:hypothetical protein